MIEIINDTPERHHDVQGDAVGAGSRGIVSGAEHWERSGAIVAGSDSEVAVGVSAGGGPMDSRAGGMADNCSRRARHSD